MRLKEIKSFQEFEENKETLIDELAKEVYNYIYSYSNYGDDNYIELYAVKKNVRRWWCNKIDLIKKLSKADAFDFATLSLKSDFIEVRPANHAAALNKCTDLINMLYSDMTDGEEYNHDGLRLFKKALELWSLNHNGDAFKLNDRTRVIYNTLLAALELPLIKKDSTLLKYLNAYNGGVNLNYYKNDYNRIITDAFDLMKEKKTPYKRYISVHPLSYIQAGEGNSWSSCYTFEGRHGNGYSGCNRFGCFGYMVDGVTLVANYLKEDIDGEDVDFRDKVYRHYIHINERGDNISLLCGRVYPQKNDGDKEKALSIFREAGAQVMEALTSRPYYIYNNCYEVRSIYSSASLYCFGYNDLTCSYCYNTNAIISTYETLEGLSNIQYNIEVGAAAYYLDNGDEWEDGDEVDGCTLEGGRVYCADCGRRIDEDDAIYIDGDYYCSDCAEYCEHCGEYYRADDMTTLYNGDRVCEDCRCNTCVYCYDIDDYCYSEDAHYSEVDDEYYYYLENIPAPEDDEDDDE